nr:hypothetical protein [uncultured Porphyromonas sp.]
MNSPPPFVAPFLQHILLRRIPSHPSAGVPFSRIRRSVHPHCAGRSYFDGHDVVGIPYRGGRRWD